MKAFDKNMASLSIRGNIDLSEVKKSKNAYINTLNTLSLLNAKIPGKRDGNSSQIKKEIYDLKYEIIGNFVKKIKSGEIKGNYKLGFDNSVKMWGISLQIGGVQKRYHIPKDLKDKIKNGI